MDTRSKIVFTAEYLFYQQGFVITGIDEVAHAAEVSTRTLYKHVGSKNELIALVLGERNKRAMRKLKTESIVELFSALEKWVKKEGNKGCMFLRAYTEAGGNAPSIVEAVSTHKSTFREIIREIVTKEIGGRENAELVDQILILFEGSVALAIYRGIAAFAPARNAALKLIELARE
jgi:AcrR family transcriptional regulator